MARGSRAVGPIARLRETWICGGGCAISWAQGQGEYVSAPGTRGAKFSPALVWPLELGLRTPTLRCGHLSGPSRTRGGFFDFEVGGHDGAYKGRVHVIVRFVGRKNGKLFDCQQLYNVLVLRVPGLEEGVMCWG